MSVIGYVHFNLTVPEINLTFPKLFCYASRKAKVGKSVDVDQEITKLGMQLAGIAVKNTATVVNDKIRAAKANRDSRQTIAELSDLVQELFSEKQELQLIAQSFEKELVAQQLTEDDIKFVSQTVVPVFEKLSESTMGAEKLEKTMAVIKPLLSPTTLRVMQILGFNFKKAVGEPLTNLSNNKISTLGDIQDVELIKIREQKEVEIFKIIQDPEAYDRMLTIRGM